MKVTSALRGENYRTKENRNIREKQTEKIYRASQHGKRDEENHSAEMENALLPNMTLKEKRRFSFHYVQEFSCRVKVIENSLKSKSTGHFFFFNHTVF